MNAFPFGQPVLPRTPSADGLRRLFVLGAYPSALHIAWNPPPLVDYAKSYGPIRALPVDNESTPFWDGHDEQRLIDDWKAAVNFDLSWGTVDLPPGLNGTTGTKLKKRVLEPLGVAHDDAWITDCLDTYRASRDVAKRIRDTYLPFAERRGLPLADLLPHPSEDAIVREAARDHELRLRHELESAAPEIIVTLGNAALRVLRTLVDAVAGAAVPAHLSDKIEHYGQPIEVRLASGRRVIWLPLAHPAAPQKYQILHDQWMKAQSIQGSGAAIYGSPHSTLKPDLGGGPAPNLDERESKT
jgi:hypothetical protein